MKRDAQEIDEGGGYIGYMEACDIIEAHIHPIKDESLDLLECVGRIAATALAARISFPSMDVSLKDGYAVKSTDVAFACVQNPKILKVIGAAFAGRGFEGRLEAGTAVSVCSGAPIPSGADAVVAGEFCKVLSSGDVHIQADAGPGRNIMPAGVEIKAGEILVRKGRRLSPGLLGLTAAAAGFDQIRVYRKPRVAIISIGDEVVAPGSTLHAGQLYASNLVTMAAWLSSLGMPCTTSVIADSEDAICRELEKQLPDAILTSGGAWGSERDLVVGAMNKMGWQKWFHYVRIGPGKGVAFGLWKNLPVFCLPGGPSSHQMAFMQLALPALSHMGGETGHPLQTVQARLSEDVTGRHPAWTEFKDAVVTHDGEGRYTVGLYQSASRLQAIARANALICVPEGRESLRRGDTVPVQLLFHR
jgi:molybdopterin molybdotransferase